MAGCKCASSSDTRASGPAGLSSLLNDKPYFASTYDEAPTPQRAAYRNRLLTLLILRCDFQRAAIYQTGHILDP